MALIEDYQQQRLIGSLSDDIFLSIAQRDGGGSYRQTLRYVSLISYWPVFLLRRVSSDKVVLMMKMTKLVARAVRFVLLFYRCTSPFLYQSSKCIFRLYNKTTAIYSVPCILSQRAIWREKKSWKERERGSRVMMFYDRATVAVIGRVVAVLVSSAEDGSLLVPTVHYKYIGSMMTWKEWCALFLLLLLLLPFVFLLSLMGCVQLYIDLVVAPSFSSSATTWFITYIRAREGAVITAI